MKQSTSNWKAHGLPYRQAETLKGIAEGLSDKEMASRAGVARGVISQTVQTLYYKLHITRGRRGQLVAEAIRAGILTSTSVLMIICTLSLSATSDANTDTPTRPRPARLLRAKTTRTVNESLLIA